MLLVRTTLQFMPKPYSNSCIVVESVKRKKSRGVGLFRYAETVEDSVWDDAQKQRDIQVRLAKYLTIVNDLSQLLYRRKYLD